LYHTGDLVKSKAVRTSVGVVGLSRYGRGVLNLRASWGMESEGAPNEQNQVSFLLDQVGSAVDPDESSRKSSIIFEYERVFMSP
jgi:hypothetical protein